MCFGQVRNGQILTVLCALFFSVANANAQDANAWLREPGGHKFEDLDEKPHDPLSVWPLTQTVQCADGRLVHLRSIIIADTQKLRLAVIDNPRGNETLADTMVKIGAIAGVNGSYFHPDWTPLGFEISFGKIIHPFVRAKLLTGVIAVSGANVRILRTSEFSPQKKWDAALQAGPFLVDHGEPVAGLEATRRAYRTAVTQDDEPSGNEGDIAHITRLVVCEPVTLAEFAQLLSKNLLTGTHTVSRALNLDGGSSTGMWVRGHEAPVQIGSANVNVRNYLAIVPRQ